MVGVGLTPEYRPVPASGAEEGLLVLGVGEALQPGGARG